MPSWINTAIVYGLIVCFWAIIFGVAVTMTRRSLRGVGEPLPEEAPAAQTSGANGHVQSAKAQGAGTASSGGAQS